MTRDIKYCKGGLGSDEADIEEKATKNQPELAIETGKKCGRLRQEYIE